MPERDEDYCRVCKTSPCAAIALQQTPGYTLKLADCEVKPKMEPRHAALFGDEFDRASSRVRRADGTRNNVLADAKRLLAEDGSVTVSLYDGGTSLSITRQEAIRASERRLLELEEAITADLYKLRDLIFEALGKLDYRPPIEAEA